MIINFPEKTFNEKKPSIEIIDSGNGYSRTWRVYFNEKTTQITEEMMVPEVSSESEDGDPENTGTTPVKKEVTREQYTYNYIETVCSSDKIPDPLQVVKNYVIEKIDEYDQSSNVNSFTLNGVSGVWLDKATRVGLMNSTTIQKNAGIENSVLWIDNICLTINVDLIIKLLGVLEVYALGCFNTTAEHKKKILDMTKIDDVINYDFTTDYPEHPNFSV